MKISMWMIAEKMKKYEPECDITADSPILTGIRFFAPDADHTPDPQYLYIRLEGEKLRLISGTDRITITGKNSYEACNDLMAVFDFYNGWESALYEAASRKSIQEIVDLGYDLLGNPVLVTDIDGNVLTMSSAYPDDGNLNWKETKAAGRISASIIGSPMRNQAGELTQWSTTPDIYTHPDGRRIIAAYLRSRAGLVAAIGLREHVRPFAPGDVWLIQTMSDVIQTAIDPKEHQGPISSAGNILSMLLDRKEVDGRLLKYLEYMLQNPWRLFILQNPDRNDALYLNTQIKHLHERDPQCICAIHDGCVVGLTAADRARPTMDPILQTRGAQRYMAGISLPFDDPHLLLTRYTQTAFLLSLSGHEPGIYLFEDSMLRYLLTLIQDHVRNEALIHPALDRLKQHDEERNGGLYETLYQYLLNERSIVQSAQALGIHKNSLLYRLQRMESILDVDLEDPEKRTYLLLSYLMDKS